MSWYYYITGQVIDDMTVVFIMNDWTMNHAEISGRGNMSFIGPYSTPDEALDKAIEGFCASGYEIAEIREVEPTYGAIDVFVWFRRDQDDTT